MKELLICGISNNNRPSFFNYHFECLKKFIDIPFEYILFDNSNDSQEYRINCEYIGAKYVKLQTTELDVFKFILHNVQNLLKYKGTLMIINLDLFLVRNYNPIERLKNKHIIASPDPGDFIIINCDIEKNLSSILHEQYNKYTVQISRYNHLNRESSPEIFKEYKSNEFSIYDDVFLKYESPTEHNLKTIYEENLFTFLSNTLINWNIPCDQENKYIISFSLYGDNPRYTHNAIINVILAQKIYKGWICRFYYDDTVPDNIIKILRSFNNVEVVKVETSSNNNSAEKMFWRFYPASEINVAAMIVRDADAWLGFRDAFLVKKWIESDKTFHIIRDHCYHTVRIMGGMWGAKRGKLPQLKKLCEEQVKQIKSHGADQNFMSDIIYPLVVDAALIHVSDGYKNDNITPFEAYPKILEFIPDIDIEKTNIMNPPHMGRKCEVCNKTHKFFIGGIFINQLQSTKNILATYGL